MFLSNVLCLQKIVFESIYFQTNLMITNILEISLAEISVRVYVSILIDEFPAEEIIKTLVV